MANGTTIDVGELLSLVATLNTRLADIRDAIKDADTTLEGLTGAPTGAAYVVTTGTTQLSAERILTGTASQITVTDGGGGGNATLSLPSVLIVPGSLQTTTNLFVNDTAHANMTIGQVWNQGANSDLIGAWKSSEIAHGLASAILSQETDDFLVLRKRVAATGGLVMQVTMEDGADNNVFLLAVAGGIGDTTDTSSSTGLITMQATEHDGANALINAPVNQNIFVIQSRSAGADTTRLLLKGDDGELHLGTTTLVALQDHNDAALIEDFEVYRTTEQEGKTFIQLSPAYQRLQDVGLVGKITAEEWDRGIRPLYSVQRLQQLHSGFSRQAARTYEALMDVMEASDPSFRGRMRTAMTARGVGQLAR